MRIAIQGIRGSYSEAAAREFAPGRELLECPDFESVLAAVESRAATHAVLPLSNKIVGDIDLVKRLLAKSSLRQANELSLTVDHVVAAVPGAKFDGVQEIISHPEALRQCGTFFDRNPQIRPVVGPDTASSLVTVLNGKNGTSAAIASRHAVAIYHAEIIHENVADDADNWTIFGLFSL